MLIMIADANPESREQLRNFLENQEYEVLIAEDGEEALGTFHEQKEIQVVFSGLMMPKLGGLELMKELKAINRKLPFVVLIPLEFPDMARQALRQGACDFLIPCLIVVIKSFAFISNHVFRGVFTYFVTQHYSAVPIGFLLASFGNGFAHLFKSKAMQYIRHC